MFENPVRQYPKNNEYSRQAIFHDCGDWLPPPRCHPPPLLHAPLAAAFHPTDAVRWVPSTVTARSQRYRFNVLRATNVFATTKKGSDANERDQLRNPEFERAQRLR